MLSQQIAWSTESKLQFVLVSKWHGVSSWKLYLVLLKLQGAMHCAHHVTVRFMIQCNLFMHLTWLRKLACFCLYLWAAAGTVQYVYAVRDIKMGEQLCVHYTSLYEPRKVRQQALLQDKFFSCACERCSTPIEHSVDRFLEVGHVSVASRLSRTSIHATNRTELNSSPVHCHLPSIASEVWFRQLRWLGHVARVPDERLPVQVLFGQLSGPGVKGRPRDSWRTVVHKDLSTLKVGLKWYKLAQNRQKPGDR